MGLILARKHGESIHIGEHIVVTAYLYDEDGRSYGRQVKLLIEAPGPLKILRSELVGKVRAENGSPP